MDGPGWGGESASEDGDSLGGDGKEGGGNRADERRGWETV